MTPPARATADRRSADQLVRHRRRDRDSGRPARPEAGDRRARGPLRPRRQPRASTSRGSSGRTACCRPSSTWRRSAHRRQQRLKGSCPWLFAYERHGDAVRDRLPLALAARPAHQRAGHGRRAADRGLGARSAAISWRRETASYDVRITAELWETHFFDHVVADGRRSSDRDRGLRRRAVRPYRRRAMTVHRDRAASAPVAARRDDSGRDVTRRRAAPRRPLPRHLRPRRLPGDHARPLGRGRAAATTRRATGPLWLVAHGWIHPTDSSINVAIGQGSARPAARAVAARSRTRPGGWAVARPDLGFPAGKNKTILVDLDGVFGPGAPAAAPAAHEPGDLLGSPRLAAGRAGRRRCDARRLAAGVGGAALSRLLASRTRPNAELARAAALRRSTAPRQRWRDLDRLLHAVRRRPRAAARRRRPLRDHERRRRAGPALPGGARRRRRAGPRLRLDRRRLGEGRRLQHRPSRKTVLPLPSHDSGRLRRAPGAPGGRSGLPAAPRAICEHYHTRYVSRRGFQAGLRPASDRPARSRP